MHDLAGVRPPVTFHVAPALACLGCLPGIPCLYYGTEQGLHGQGNDEAVREALWGGPGFDQTSTFYRTTRAVIALRNKRMALRYGRFYFRPLSGDGQNFGISPFPAGVLSFSRILADDEVLAVANTDSNQGHDLEVIIDSTLNPVGTKYQILFSNKQDPIPPGPVTQTGPVTVNEVDGTIGHGPLHVVHVTLKPMEVQILAR